MSLFQTKELWQCKLNDAADSSFLCLSVANLIGKSDQIIIGTSNGFLHIYEPCTKQEEISSLNPADSHDGLLLVKELKYPILQTLCGKFKTNTNKLQLCILHQKSVAVYSMQERFSKTFLHGKDYHLEILYEYPLSHNAYNMISGSLNDHDDSNFICVQSLDGVLYIFEQEMNAFSHYLPDFLLPGPLCFSNEVNLFLTVSSTWDVQTFKYEKILLNANRLSTAENKADEKRQLLIPEWQYLLGERAVEVAAVEDPTALFSFIILGEQNLFCFSCNGALVTMKRLDYAPLCLHFYGLTQDSKVRYITTTDDGTMLFYNDTTLRWAAKLPFVPLNLALGRIRGIDGVIVALSSTGSIHCVYLGTDPMIQQIRLKWHSTETYEKRLEVYKEMTHKMKRLKMKDDFIESRIQQKELNVDILIMNKFHKEYKSLIQFGAEEELEPAFLIKLTEKRSAKRTLINKKAVQVRIVQRQFFIKLKDIHSGSLADLHQVLQQMNKEIIHLLEEHSKINASLKTALNALRAGNHLISTLICYSYNLKGREMESVAKVLEISPDDAFGENWLPNVIAGLESLQQSADNPKNVTLSAYEETSANEYSLFEQLLTSLVKKLQSGEKLTLYEDSPANLKQSN
ncbi:Protein PTHB1 [Trichinella spiralis]|uniref:Protein PTHB1 n=1 Tax=Trichinella spiralis TaxID=6334 RepID=A0ABR3K5R3_TRISP